MNYTDTVGRVNKHNKCDLCGRLPGECVQHHKIEGTYQGARRHARNLKAVTSYHSDVAADLVGMRLCPDCYKERVTTPHDAKYNTYR